MVPQEVTLEGKGESLRRFAGASLIYVPPFPSRASAGLAKIGHFGGGTSTKRTLIVWMTLATSLHLMMI